MDASQSSVEQDAGSDASCECFLDSDGDGERPLPCGLDCVEWDPLRAPGLPDPVGDSVDSDCSGGDGEDADRDGSVARSSGGNDCDDSDPLAYPGAPDNAGWLIEDLPVLGIFGTLALAEGGVPTFMDGQGVSCVDPQDGDGEESPPAAAREATFRRAGGWSAPRADGGCVSGEIVAARGPIGQVHAVARLSGSDTECALFETVLPGTPADAPRPTSGRVCQLSPTHVAPAIAVSSCGEVLVAVPDEEDRLIGTHFPAGHNPQSLLIEAAPVTAVSAQWAGAEARVAYLVFEGEHRSVHIARGWRYDWEVETTWDPLWGESFDLALTVDDAFGERVAVLSSTGIWVITPGDAGPSAELVSAGSSMAPLGNAIAASVSDDGVHHLAWIVAASDSAHGEVRYATDGGGGGWSVEPLGEGDGWVSLVLDRRGKPHIAWYIERRGSELDDHAARYATFVGIDGIDENCDGVDGVDADGDGHASRETGGDDPDDSSAG